MYAQIKCQDCGNEINIHEINGEYVCADCGLVIGPILMNDREWGSNSDIEGKARTGNPTNPLFSEYVLRTEISTPYTDAHGHKLSSEAVKKYRDLKNKDDQSSSTQRSLRSAFHEIKRLQSQAELPPNTLDEAFWIYKKAHKAKLIRGHSINGIAAAALYIACRRQSYPMAFKEFGEIVNVDFKELGRCVRLLIMKLGMKTERHDLKSMIFRLGSELDMTIPTRRKAIQILKEAKEKGITTGKNPISVAAAALYIAGLQTGERRTQQQLAKVAKTTPVTIRHRFKELVDALGLSDIEVRRGAAATAVYFDSPHTALENI